MTTNKQIYLSEFNFNDKTDLIKYKSDLNESVDKKLQRRELFLEMYKDMPNTCGLGKFINGHYILDVDLSNLHLRRLGFCNTYFINIYASKTTFEETVFIHGDIKFKGEVNFKTTVFIGSLEFGDEARVLDNILFMNSSISNSKIKVIRNSKFDNVSLYRTDVKRFENCDLFNVRVDDKSLYDRAFNCVNVPQVYNVNRNVEIVAYGDGRFSLNLKGKIQGYFSTKDKDSIEKQAGVRINSYYTSHKAFFDVIDFERVEYKYDDTFIDLEEGENDA